MNALAALGQSGGLVVLAAIAITIVTGGLWHWVPMLGSIVGTGVYIVTR